MVRWIREGSCNSCGECCKVSHELMTPGFSPDSEGRRFECRYFDVLPDGKGLCMIKTGVLVLEDLPVEHQNYFKNECLPYPNPEDPAHTPPRHKLPEKCGYRMVRVE